MSRQILYKRPVCPKNGVIAIYRGDITKIKAFAIVNPSNNQLTPQSTLWGVDRYLHEKAGPRLLDACTVLNGCQTGEAKITAGYNLPGMCTYSWLIDYTDVESKLSRVQMKSIFT